MIYQCKCKRPGSIKTGSPHHSSAVKKWMCEKCKEEARIVSNSAYSQSTSVILKLEAFHKRWIISIHACVTE